MLGLHHAIQIQLDKKGIHYRRHENAFVEVADPEAIRKASESLHGRDALNGVNHWMNLFFKFDKGKYSTCSKYLQHEWHLSQVEISSNIVFNSTMKNDAIKLAAQPSQIEEAYESLHKGLALLTQQLAINC